MNKQFYILMLVMFVVVASCKKSEFSSATRHSRNGKVSYTKNFEFERNRKSKTKPIQSQRSYEKPASSQVVSARQLPTFEITKFTPANSNQNLIASTSTDAVVIQKERTLASSIPSDFFRMELDKKMKAISVPDTYRGDSPKYNTIKTKPGNYQHQKTERLGLTGFILTLIAWVLVYAGFLCILGIIFGAVSLHKINKHPERFKGRGFAIVSIILGIVGIIIGTIVLIAL
jgi:hypothetical protein